MKKHQLILSAALVAVLVALAPRPAMAYVGPGAGLSAIGAFLAIVAGIVIAIFGFLWYPIKRLLRTLRQPADDAAANDENASSPDDPSGGATG